MSFNGQISGSLAPQGAKQGNLSGNIGAVTPAIRDGAVTTAKIADAAVTIAKLAQDVTALINSKGDASDVAQLQEDVEALQTITAGLGTASTYGVANNLTQAAAGSAVLDAYQGKLLGDRMTTAEGDIASLNDGYTNLHFADLLWSNPDSTQSFGAQSVTINAAKYDFFMCVFRNSTDRERFETCIASKGLPFYHTSNLYRGTTKYLLGRVVTVGENSAFFNSASMTNASLIESTDDTVLIPHALYGIGVIKS